MIVLGIAPGLGALAYSALGWSPERPTDYQSLDCDVLHGGRRLTVGDALAVARRCRAHHLVLDVVLSRYPPAVVALAPPVSRQEPPEHVGAVRVLIQGVAYALGVPLHDFGERREMLDALDARQQGLGAAVHERLNGSLGSRDRRIVLATGAALAAIAVSCDTLG